MLSLTLKPGQAIQIGDIAFVAVEEKSSNSVRLTIHSSVRPIRLIKDGVMSREFTTGLTGEVRFPKSFGEPIPLAAPAPLAERLEPA